jgi:sugar lactone lactonase YvrE
VSTLAGNGVFAYADGTGGPTGTAEFNGPVGVVEDAQGNVFVADTQNSRIRKIDPSGNVTTVAGNGNSNSADGTGGPNGTAEICQPQGLALDAQGNLIVADSFNSIRKIDPLGNVTTIAGSKNGGFVDGTGGPNGTAEFGWPTGVAVDAQGNIFVSELSNNAIRKIDPSGNVTTIAGDGKTGFVDGPGGRNGTAEFNIPNGIAIDAQGNLFVADTGNNAIRKIDSSGVVTTLAGNGTAGDLDGTGGQLGTAEFNLPYGVAVDAQGNVFVADQANNRIRKIDPSGNVTTLTGNGTAGFFDGTGGPTGTAEFNGPSGVAVDAQGSVLVGDSNNLRIRKVDPAGDVITVAGNGDHGYRDGTGGANGTAEFDNPTGVAVDAQGNVFVADWMNNRIRKIDPLGNVTTLAGNGLEGYADGTGGANGTAEFKSPFGVAVDARGHVFVADSGNNRIREIDQSGNVTTLAGNGQYGWTDGTGGPNGTTEFFLPDGVAVDAQGNVIVADTGNCAVRKIDPSGNVTSVAGTGHYGFADGPGGTAQFSYPDSVAVDAQGNIFVADLGNNRIRKIDAPGNVTTYAGNGISGYSDGTGGSNGTAEFCFPDGIAIDAQGNVIVADTCNDRIRKISPSGNVSTLAGNGGHGFADGTGGPHGGAEFRGPREVTVDAQGNVFVADTDNNRIRQISP